ncbi:MAG: T9SS type A sorting domain-containing protein, partial [Bacteroidales bacterium]|nr:T9SS type A sorting domain-containing protein [Bacteroidales bacterium]
MKHLNKLTMLLMALTMSTSLMAQTPVAPTAGAGTELSPWEIANLNNLAWLQQSSNYANWDKYYIQTTDIDASATSTWHSGAGFSPIGNLTTKFTGSYDGDGHTIENLYIYRPSQLRVGLFGYISHAEIYDIGVTNVDITGGDYVGGLVGYDYLSTISNSYSTGSVSGSERVGGLVGDNYNSTVSNSYSTGSVSGTKYVGGLVGDNPNSNISNSYSTGSVSGTRYVGGLVGINFQSPGTYITVSNSYSTGSVSGSSDVGGLVAYNNATVTNSFWDTETSGQSSSAGGTGKNTTQMQTQSTFTGWDFTGSTCGTDYNWEINSTDNNGYPHLCWQVFPNPGLWTGATDTDWNTATNWDDGNVPTSTVDVTIPDVTNAPVISSTGTASCTDLTIETGAVLTIQSDATGTGSLITNGTITNNGTVNVERYISESVWHLISVPNNVTTANTFLGDYLQTWDETTATWTDITEPTTALIPVKGYDFWGTPAKATTYTFTGTPNTGNQSLSVTYTEVAGHDNDGANLLGNPYPSSIDWSGLDDTWGAVYYWDGIAYKEWNNGAGSGSQYVPPLQGFFIVAASNGTFQLANSDRTHSGAANYYKSSNEITNGLVLEASNGSYNDELYIIFNEEASEGFDLQHDAYKFLSYTEGLSELYSFTDDKMLSIDVRPSCETIQLGFQNDENGIYNIGIKEMADISEAILEDTKTGTFHNLQNGSYEFAWVITDNEKRFKLHLNVLGIEEGITHQKETLIYASGKTIYIKNMESQENVQVKILDITCRIVLEKNIQSTGTVVIPTNLKSGVYIVSLISGNKIETEKVFIN